MFQNPFKGLSKLDYIALSMLLLMAIGNWLLEPYKTMIKDYLTNWPPFVVYIIVAALFNLVVAFIVITVSGDKSEKWWMGKQPQSAWKKAYLETMEKEEKNNKWTYAAMSIWLISIILSYVILSVAIMTNLLFTETMSLFIIYLAAYFLFRSIPLMASLKWK